MALISRDLYRFDDFELQPSRRVLLRGTGKIPIAPKTFEVLLCLVANAGRVVLKEELLKTVWPESFVEESNLTQHIFWLRKALADKAGYIETIPGRGYEFTGSVQIVTEAEQPAKGPSQSGPGYRVQVSAEQTRVIVDQTIVTAVQSTTPALGAPKRRWQFVVTGAALVLLSTAGWAVWRATHSVVPGDHHEVVLADFENSTGDPDFGRALKTLLAIDLSQSPYLAVASERDTRKVLKLMNQPADSDLTSATAREICERLNDQVVLGGSIARFGQRYLVTLTATDCADGRNLMQTRAESRDREGVIGAVDSVAADMRKRLGEPLRDLRSNGQHLVLTHTFSIEALQVYSQARTLHMKAKFAEAVPLYKRAIELDPNFTDAWAQLGNCYANLGEGVAGQEAMAKAYQLRDFAEEPEKLRITAMYEFWKTGDRHAAIRNFQNWAALYPRASSPWNLLGEFQYGVGYVDQGIDAEKHALILDPTSTLAYSDLAEMQRVAGRLEDAKATCRKAIGRGIDTVDLHRTLLDVAFLQHDDGGMQEQLDWYRNKAEEEDRETTLADLDASQGKISSAVARYQHVADLETKDGRSESALQDFSSVPQLEADVGLTNDARQHLERYRSAEPMFGWALTSVSVAAAEVGDLDLAEKKFQFMRDHGKQDSDVLEMFIPKCEAAFALARGKPEQAIVALKPAAPYETAFSTVIEMRARAYLAAKQPEAAKQAYHSLIDKPFISGIAPAVPLAYLGLARAEEIEGNHAGARQEYKTFFSLWKDADHDLPVLKQARAEYTAIPDFAARAAVKLR
jgi:eukaryotic-like serine/threonine-protein kinase